MDPEKDTKTKELLLFQVGRVQLALPLMRVNSIQSAKSVLAMQPEGRMFFAAEINGKIMHLFDLAAIFEQQTGDNESEHKKLILVDTQKSSIGLIVDSVGRVASAASGEVSPLSPLFEDLSMSCFPSVLRHENDHFLILSPEGILNLAPDNNLSQGVPDMPGIEKFSPLTAGKDLMKRPG